MRYARPKPGEWVKPVKRGYKMACCDCGLVHRVDFEHVKFGNGRKIIFRVYRDVLATAAMRRETMKAAKCQSVKRGRKRSQTERWRQL